MRVLLVPNRDKGQAVEAARSLASWLVANGHEPVLGEPDALASGLDDQSVQPGAFGPLDLAVALGGDGTILRAAHLLSGADTPILGVNLGRLGFLAGANQSELPRAVEQVLAGAGTIERRSVLESRAVVGGREAGVYHALNEVFVGRGPGGRAVDAAVAVNGVAVWHCVCDGVIVATPTGSTAYALSAGGPLIAPEVRAMLLVPVSPHTLLARPVVLAPDDVVTITLPDPTRAEACLVVDGDLAPCRTSLDQVEIRLGMHDVSLVKLDGRGFYDAARDTFFVG